MPEVIIGSVCLVVAFIAYNLKPSSSKFPGGGHIDSTTVRAIIFFVSLAIAGAIILRALWVNIKFIITWWN